LNRRLLRDIGRQVYRNSSNKMKQNGDRALALENFMGDKIKCFVPRFVSFCYLLADSLAVEQHIEGLLHGTCGDDLSGVDEEDLIGVGDRVEAMRDDDLRRRCGQLVQDLLKLLLRDGVDVRRSFIEDEDFGISQDSPDERDELLLSEADGVTSCQNF